MNKDAEAKKVPKLRFKEFSGEWEEKKLGDVAYMKAGKFIKASNIYASQKNNLYPCYGGNGLRGYTKVHTHEGVYSLIGRQGALCGNIQLTNGKFHATEHAVVVTPLNDNDSIWLYFQLNRLNLNRFATGQAQPGLSVDVIQQIKTNIPTLPEQQKISDCLSTWDDSIENLKSLIENKKLYKKGMMQKLFSQEIRFKDDDGGDYPEWIEMRLGEIAKISTGNSNREDSSLDGEYTFFDRSEDIRTSSIYLFDSEAVIVAGEGQRFIPKYFIGKFDLHQRTYAIMDFKDACGKFIFYMIHTKQNYFLAQAVGSTVKSLRLPMFKKMVLNLPTIQEQTKIANFLSAIDDEIELLEQELEQLQLQKKGLMQGMFV